MIKILTTETRLMNYAAWYAMRYMPSFRKLQEVLMKKSWDNSVLVNVVSTRMQEYISEERTVDGLVRMHLDQGKTIEWVKRKLKEKLFDPEVTAKVLEEYGEWFASWNTYAQNIERKVQEFVSKGKSKQYIRWALLQKYPSFKSEIAELLEAYCADETESVLKELQKLQKKHDIGDMKERQKLIQKLCLKGFSYDLIRTVLKTER